MNRLHVLIVEDEDLLRTGLELIIGAEADMRVIGAVRNGLEAIESIKQAKPDIVLLDIQMPVMNGIDCIREIRKLYMDLPILVMTTFSEDEYIFQALAYGANGYLLKGIHLKKIIQSIRAIMDGSYILPKEIAARITQYVFKNDSYLKERGIQVFFEQNTHYTRKEQEIILLLFNRLPNKEIAAQLSFSEGTIKNKLSAIYDKMGVGSRQEAIRFLEGSVNTP